MVNIMTAPAPASPPATVSRPAMLAPVSARDCSVSALEADESIGSWVAAVLPSTTRGRFPSLVSLKPGAGVDSPACNSVGEVVGPLVGLVMSLSEGCSLGVSLGSVVIVSVGSGDEDSVGSPVGVSVGSSVGVAGGAV